MKKNYQRKERKSNHKLEVVGGQELLVRVPLPMAEVWAEMQTKVEQLTGQAGLQIRGLYWAEGSQTRVLLPTHAPGADELLTKERERKRRSGVPKQRPRKRNIAERYNRILMETKAVMLLIPKSAGVWANNGTR